MKNQKNTQDSGGIGKKKHEISYLQNNHQKKSSKADERTSEAPLALFLPMIPAGLCLRVAVAVKATACGSNIKY